MTNFLSNSAWAPDKITRGKDITHAEYKIKDWDKWVRAEVTDKDGRVAWSNIMFINKD